jgi:hypothetical protein
MSAMTPLSAGDFEKQGISLALFSRVLDVLEALNQSASAIQCCYTAMSVIYG